MAGTEWLTGWGGRTTDELIALEDQYRIDSLVVAFDEAVQAKAEIDPSKLSNPEWFILTVEALEREVNNGGYSQFFVNLGFYAGLAPDALNAIGCPITSRISKRAVDGLGLGSTVGPRDMDAIAAAASADDPKIAEILDACDQAYFGSGEVIADRLFEYIKANAGRVVLPAST